jgi:hypothetical protein
VLVLLLVPCSEVPLLTGEVAVVPLSSMDAVSAAPAPPPIRPAAIATAASRATPRPGAPVPALRARGRGRRGGWQPVRVGGAPRVLGVPGVRAAGAGGGRVRGDSGRVWVWSLMSITVRPDPGRSL